MPTDFCAEEQDGSSADATPIVPPSRGVGVADDDCTPKSEMPVALHLVTPGGTRDASKLPHDVAVGDYFGVHADAAAHGTPTSATAQAEMTPTIAPSSASDGQRSPLLRPNVAQTAVSNFSIDSGDSAATLRPALSDATVPTLHRPAYPNQSYAALHHQQYPPPYQPSGARRAGPRPHQIFTFSSAIASLHANGTRSAISSPSLAPSVGLFKPGGNPSHHSLDGVESPGTYASPFLHFTHRAVPKETHIADVDKDPVSGRKLINEYEIVDELGRGTHGKVKFARDLNTQDTYVAIKIVERYSKRRRLGKLGTTEDKVKKEVAILKKARHPNVVALLEVIDDPTRKKVYIVLEWVERGEIFWRHKPDPDFREVAMLEARRYEREKSKSDDPDLRDLDEAVFWEAQKRLNRSERRRARRQRRGKRHAQDHPAHWSMELAGESDTDGSDDDLLSRISATTTSDSTSSGLREETDRRPSRPSLPPSAFTDATVRPASGMEHYLPLTPETLDSGHTPASVNPTGLEGTMYGPSETHDAMLGKMLSPGRLGKRRPEELSRLAKEILDSDLDPELEYVPVMTMEQIRGAFRDTLLGLQYLHYQGIVHRDIKPPNLLMTKDNRVKISDFGVSYLGRPVHEGEPGEDMSEHEAQDLDDEAKELAKTVGTPAFYAPELCITDPTDDPLPVTKAIDVWALGVTLFCMLFARTPFVDSEFVVMRQIADEDIHIPHQRLQPVDTKPKSRPSSHGRNYSPMAAGRRKEAQLVYEDLGIELHDLLTRLLIKDPRRRITLEEVRHHPWVIADVADPSRWLEETSPNHHNQGKKIEISREELNTAVVPLQFLDNVKSAAKKMAESIMSIGKGRTRATSNAGSQYSASPAPSASSSSSAISQDARQHSLLGDESIFSALKASRESHDRPTVQSTATSPENERRGGFFDSFVRATAGSSETSNDDRPMSYRPAPQRAMTMMSTAGSVRTVKQSDFRHEPADESPPPSPGAPGTPISLASPGGHSLGGLLGGASRHLLRAVRERSAHGALDRRTLGDNKRSFESLDSHAEPSVAVSQTTAAGSVQQPEALRELTPSSSTHNSPFSSRPVSVAASDHPHAIDAHSLTHLSSKTSMTSMSRIIKGHVEESPLVYSRSQSRTAPESSAEDWERADKERVRRLVMEMKDEANRTGPSPRPASAPPEYEEENGCPSSPDDRHRRQHEARFPSVGDISNPATSNEASPTGRLSGMLSSSSDLGSAVSMSISNPSMPSAISEASSVDVYHDYYQIGDYRKVPFANGLTPGHGAASASSRGYFDEGYSPDEDAAIDSNDGQDSDSSSNSDGGLVMSRRKSASKQAARAASTLSDSQGKERRNTGLSARSKASSRSGSNGTMKKANPRSGEEGTINGGSSLDVHIE